MLILVLLVCSIQFFGGEAIPFLQEMNDLGSSDEYLNTMPYSKEQIMEVREKLNLTYDKHHGDPDEYLSVPELINKYGYPVEEHFTTTKDGYILRMHRIPPTKPGIAPCHRTVFLMHGILMSSADWVLLGPKKAFAYHLADLGYDVWMGNARGNTQSRNHTKLKPSHSKFWQFSWHEIGTKDLPAMIDYVLKETKQKQLYHIGYSQGTTSFYVMCSELPHYNKKIIAHYSLAPIAYMRHAFSPILKLASKFVYTLETLSKLLGVNELLPHSSLLTMLGNDFCDAGEKTEIICKDTLFLMTGFDKAEFNDTFLPTLMGHSPAGASAKQIFHYAQLIDSGKFRQYDHFPFNALHYGPAHPIWPPSYNLKNIKAPVYLYYSRNDWLSSEKDVTTLCNELGNCKAQILVQENTFNHLDYVIAMHAREKVYEPVAQDIERHTKKLTEYGNDSFEEGEYDSNEF